MEGHVENRTISQEREGGCTVRPKVNRVLTLARDGPSVTEVQRVPTGESIQSSESLVD